MIRPAPPVRRTASALRGLALCLLGALTSCVGNGDLQTSVSGQIVGVDGKPLGPGVIMIERGPVHAGAYETGGLIDKNGRFTVALEGGSLYGLHLFHSDYQYLPLEIDVQDHEQVVLTSSMVSWEVWKDLTGLPTWPAQPTDESLVRMPFDDSKTDNPVLHWVKMAYEGEELLVITAKVSDPTHDLSRMVLAYDTATAGGYALNPPSAPDKNGNYPEGIYQLKVFVDQRHVPGETVWYFTIADNMCNSPPIHAMTMPAR